MERNLRLYPIYQACQHLLFWVPVFFLYFQEHVSVDQVLLLEAIYYLSTVVLEVPSGWLSDRVGRRPTLILAAVAAVAGHSIFALGGSFPAFAAAQVLVAGSAAFNSGTDSALLYDSLLALGRAGELVPREGRALAAAFVAYGLSALAGGALAGIDLSLAYVLSAAGGLCALGVALAFREPPRPASGYRPTLRAVLGSVRQPALRWVFALSVALVVFEHVPFELFQPYLELLIGPVGTGYSSTPLASGGLVALMMLLSAPAGTQARRIADRVGVGGALLGCLALYGVIVGAMAAALHPAVVALIALRSVPQAVAAPLLSGAVHPRVRSEVRATYLSIQSLAGRLAFAVTLAACAAVVGPAQSLGYPAMRELLGVFALACAVAVVLLSLTVRALRR